MGGGCCIMDNPISNFFSDLFSGSSGGCSYTPSANINVDHSTKIANELAKMKDNMRKETEDDERKLMEYIGRSMNSFLRELSQINENTYGGKKLNMNIAGIKAENTKLAESVRGHIGRVLDNRLDLKDRELSVILEERDDKKRKKNFKDFCQKVKKEALMSLKKQIEETVQKQNELVQSEIKQRLNEVEKNMSAMKAEYESLLSSRQAGEVKAEKIQVDHMYQYTLFDILQEQVRNEDDTYAEEMA